MTRIFNVLLLLAGCSSMARGATLTFDDLARGTPIEDHYPAVHFSAGWIANPSPFTPSSPPNTAVAEQSGVIEFDGEVWSLTFYASGANFFLTSCTFKVLDSQNQVLGEYSVWYEFENVWVSFYKVGVRKLTVSCEDSNAVIGIDDLHLLVCLDQDGDGHQGREPDDCPLATDCCDGGTETGIPGCTAVSAATMHPGGAEICGDGIDQDCDGRDLPCLCTDLDGDGVQASWCGGTDCCDEGIEEVPGCATATAAGIHPGAAETCGNGVDEDCDGSDTACPPCRALATLACGNAGLADTSVGARQFSAYCGQGGGAWTGYEYTFGLQVATPAAVEFTIEAVDPLANLDLFVLADYGDPGVCNPQACLGRSVSPASAERVVFFAASDTPYFMVVDGNADPGPFHFAVACLQESSEADISIACGDSKVGSTVGGGSAVSAWKGIQGAMLGPDAAFAFSPADDQEATARLDIHPVEGVPVDLTLVVVESDGTGRCPASGVIGFSDLVQAGGENPPEEIGFLARAGKLYCLVVDGHTADQAAEFELTLGCEAVCAKGLTACGDSCVDTATDPAHCGRCDRACGSTQVCDQGQCADTCPGGTSRCGSTCADTLSDPSHCGECFRVCAFVHAAALCQAGVCVPGECTAGWADCNGLPADDCETDLLTRTNCGACDRNCVGAQVCSQGQCSESCPQGTILCDGGCADPRTDPRHCGACGNACSDGDRCTGGICLSACLGAEEICDDQDNDCDGQVDEGGVCDRMGIGCHTGAGPGAPVVPILAGAWLLLCWRRREAA